MKKSMEDHVKSIKRPENLRIGMMIQEQRSKCGPRSCPFEYHAFAFGQSPFHAPDVLVKSLGAYAHKSEHSPAEGIREVRESICDFNRRKFGMDLDPDRILVGPGTKDLMHLLFDIVKRERRCPIASLDMSFSHRAIARQAFSRTQDELPGWIQGHGWIPRGRSERHP